MASGYMYLVTNVRKPTRDITVNIFSARFFLFPQGFFYFRKVIFYFRKVCLISARFVLFPQGLFYFRKVYLSPQGFVHFRKVCFISARLYYFRKVYFISARLFLFPRGFIIHLLNLGLANANISTLLFEARHYAKWPGPSSTLVVTIENIFAEIKITLRK